MCFGASARSRMRSASRKCCSAVGVVAECALHEREPRQRSGDVGVLRALGLRDPEQTLEHRLGARMLGLTDVQPTQLVEHRAEGRVIGAEAAFADLERFGEESFGVSRPAELLLELSEMNERGNELPVEARFTSRHVERRAKCDGRGRAVTAARASRAASICSVYSRLTSAICHAAR